MLFELSVLLYRVWGVQQDPEAFRIHHCVWCFSGVFGGDVWTRVAVSLSLQAHYSAICNQPLRSAQSDREAVTIDYLMVDLGELYIHSQLCNYVAPTCWKQVEMKKNVNVPMQHANATHNGCVYIAPGEGGELSALLPMVSSFTSCGW